MGWRQWLPWCWVFSKWDLGLCFLSSLDRKHLKKMVLFPQRSVFLPTSEPSYPVPHHKDMLCPLHRENIAGPFLCLIPASSSQHTPEGTGPLLQTVPHRAELSGPGIQPWVESARNRIQVQHLLIFLHSKMCLLVIKVVIWNNESSMLHQQCMYLFKQYLSVLFLHLHNFFDQLFYYSSFRVRFPFNGLQIL